MKKFTPKQEMRDEQKIKVAIMIVQTMSQQINDFIS